MKTIEMYSSERRSIMVRWVHFQKVLFLTLLVIQCLSTAWGVTYYVAMNGDDLQPGTEVQPWRTLTKANSIAKSGDMIIVGEGTWTESPTTARHGTVDSPIVWRGSGDNSVINGFSVRHDYIHLRDFQVKGTFTIGGQNADVNGGKESGLVANHIIVENCLFTRTNASKISVGGNPPFYTGPVGTIIRNNRFIENAANAPAVGFGACDGLIENNYFTSTLGGDAIFLFGRRNIYRGNRFENWSRPANSTQHTDLFQSFSNNGEISEDHIIENNFAINCQGTQLGNVDNVGDPARVKNWTIRNNVFIRVSNPLNLYAPGFKIHNNSFVQSPFKAGSCIILCAAPRGNANGASIINNIFYKGGYIESSKTQGFYAFNQSSGYKLEDLFIDNNLVVGSGVGTVKDASWTWFSANKNGFNGVDPLFVNSVNPTKPEDLRLQATSPVIGKGRDLSEFFTTDFSGRQRGAKWDIGAFQSGQGLSAPTGFRTQ